MIDRIKTWTLSLLVLLSVVLTWQLWTFQPHYDLLTPTERVEREGLANRSDLAELIIPEKMIHHHAESGTSLSFPYMFSFNVILGQMRNWTLENILPVPDTDAVDVLERASEADGIELYFPVSLPADVLAELMVLELPSVMTAKIDVLWLYEDVDEHSVRALLISESEQQLWRAQTNISMTDLEMYRSSASDRFSYTAYVWEEQSADRKWPKRHYLPDEPVSISSQRYLYQKVSEDLVIFFLFTDPTLVRQIDERGRVGFYTDGTKGLQLDAEQMLLHFFHPQDEISRETLNKQAIQRGIQYVNQHRGWDMTYRLEHIQEPPLDRPQKVQYRQMLADQRILYPVYHASADSEQHFISLEMNEDQVVGYKRPLFELDQPIEEHSRLLASGEQLLEWMNEEGISLEQVDRIRLGYKSEISDYYIHYEPYWVIHYEDGSIEFADVEAEMSSGNEESS